MATDIYKAPVTREVVIGGKVYVVTFAPAGVELREKGKRTAYGPVAWSRILFEGEKLAALALREERETRRTVRRVSRNLLGGR